MNWREQIKAQFHSCPEHIQNKMTLALSEMEHLLILNELLTIMSNQNPTGGVSQIIQNNGPV